MDYEYWRRSGKPAVRIMGVEPENACGPVPLPGFESGTLSYDDSLEGLKRVTGNVFGPEAVKVFGQAPTGKKVAEKLCDRLGIECLPAGIQVQLQPLLPFACLHVSGTCRRVYTIPQATA